MMTRNALTLAEMVVVLCILAALGGIVLPLCSDQMSSAAAATTRSTLTRSRDAMQQYWEDTKLIPLDGITTASTELNRFQIQWLLNNPVTGDRTSGFDRNTHNGWNGPYLISATTAPSAPTGLIDGWDRTLVTQYVNPGDALRDVRIVSAGPNGIIDIPTGTATSALTLNSIGDDIYVSLLLR